MRPVQGIFQAKDYPNLLVGLDDPDDAAVWQLDGKQAIVVTTDFFTPVVDDPYDFGAIAATNALSDVYAMGAEPFLALNIAALPVDLPVEIGGEILRGGAEKAREAGVVIAGGHSVQDKEPKYGLVVIGKVKPGQQLTKQGVQVGDYLVLTKPLGFGTTTTALKRQVAAEQDVREAVAWMTRLNKQASLIARELELKAATDVTGFSLLGHAWEMCQASKVGMRINYDELPFLENAREYAREYIFPGGAFDNSNYFKTHVRFSKELEEWERMLLFDPQTSGGLLLAVPPEKLTRFKARAIEMDQPVWVIGEATSGVMIEIV